MKLNNLSMLTLMALAASTSCAADAVAGERHTASATSSAPTIPSPLGMNCGAVGGGDFGLQAGIAGASGLNNMGLLIRIWGEVASVNNTRFKVNDGSGNVTVEVPVGVDVPSAGACVAVTGISSCEKVDGRITPLIKARGSEDIQVPRDSGEIVEKGKFPVVVVAANDMGDFGSFTPGTATGGFQEAIDYCIADHFDLWVKGGAKGPVPYADTTINIPAVRNFKIEAGGCYVLNGIGGGSPTPMIVIDSAQNCRYDLGLIVYGGTGQAVTIRPTTALSNGVKAFTDSEMRGECVTNGFPFTGGERPGIAVVFDSTDGAISHNDLYFIATMNLGAQFWIVDGGYGFHHNRLTCNHLHTNATNSTLLFSGTGGYQNDITCAIGVDQGAAGVKGVDIRGSNNMVHVITRGGFPNSNDVIFESSATGNVVNILPDTDTNDPLTVVTDSASDPTNRITWTGAQAPISSQTIPTGTYTYTQRLYPATVRLSGGAISNVAHIRGPGSITYGASYRNDILLSPGDQLQVTSSQSPTLHATPRIR